MNSPIPPGLDAFSKLPAAQQAEVLALVRQHKKIEAIKLYRELVPSTGLAEAKAVVEALSGAPAAPSSSAPQEVEAAAPPLPLSPAQEQELVSLLQRRQKVAAIKRYRELRPGTELMDARKAVEALGARHGLKVASNCFVATAVYGGDSVEVAVLRDWRDACLARSAAGRGLICLYGLAGPPLAVLTRRSPWLRRGIQRLLGRFVAHLSAQAGRADAARPGFARCR